MTHDKPELPNVLDSAFGPRRTAHGGDEDPSGRRRICAVYCCFSQCEPHKYYCEMHRAIYRATEMTIPMEDQLDEAREANPSVPTETERAVTEATRTIYLPGDPPRRRMVRNVGPGSPLGENERYDDALIEGLRREQALRDEVASLLELNTMSNTLNDNQADTIRALQRRGGSVREAHRWGWQSAEEYLVGTTNEDAEESSWLKNKEHLIPAQRTGGKSKS